MPTRSQTSITTVLNTIKNRIVSSAIFSSSTCFFSIQPDLLEYPPSDIYCVLTPGSLAVDQGIFEGAGNDCVFIHGNLQITLWHNNALDEASRDTIATTDSAIGVGKKLKDLINALQIYDPTTLDDAIFAEPMRMIRSGRIRRDKTRPEWSTYETEWEICFTVNVA